MHLTRATNYALRALVELARHGYAAKSDLKSLARELDIPTAFLGKVLQGLARAGLVEGCRGVRGGYRLARPPDEINVRAVVEATEGGVRFARCLTPRTRCGRRSGCDTRQLWERLQERVNEALESETVAALVAADYGQERGG